MAKKKKKKAAPAAKKKAVPAKKKAAPAKKAPAPKKKKKKAQPFRSTWLDDSAKVPMIAEKTRSLKTFLDAVADGAIDESEMKAQEDRLVAKMEEVEPLLDEKLHAKVTELLCELTAYDLMQVMHSLHQTRPATQFEG